jgi:O-antigen/teichoic acid export membrane protein
VKTASSLFLNTLAQLFAKVVTTGSTLLVTYLISRKMGTTGLGEFIATTSYVALFYLLADFGINAVFTKRIHKPGNTEEISVGDNILFYFKNLLSIRLILGIITSFIAVALLSFLNYPANVKAAIILAALMIISQNLFITANGIFQIKLRYEFSAIADSVGSFITLMLVFLFLQSGLGVIFIILAYVIGSVFRFSIGLLLARHLSGGIGLGGDTKVWGDFLLASLPLGMIAIFSQIMANIDKVIISLIPLSPHLGYTNIQAVGIYGLAYKFFDVTLVLPTYIMNSAFPLFVKTGKEDMSKLKVIVKRLGLVMFGFSIVVAFVGYYLTPFVLGLFNKGPDLSGSIFSLRILLLGMPLFYLSALLVWLGVAIDKQKQLIVVYFISALTNVVMNIWLVPRFGFIVSALLTPVSELVVVLGAVFLVWQSWKSSD